MKIEVPAATASLTERCSPVTQQAAYNAYFLDDPSLRSGTERVIYRLRSFTVGQEKWPVRVVIRFLAGFHSSIRAAKGAQKAIE